jgi:Polyketide cyclase / dehydrase and lipid transport
MAVVIGTPEVALSARGARDGSVSSATLGAWRRQPEAVGVVAREHRVTAAIDAQAPIEVVWDLLGRFADYGDWLESTTEVLRADDEVVIGAGFVERSRISGVWMATIRWTLTELEPGSRLVFRGEGVWAIERLGFSVDLAELGTSTELTLTLWYTPRFGPVGSALDVLTRSNVTNDQKRTVRTLATLAEHRAHRDEPSEAG